MGKQPINLFDLRYWHDFSAGLIGKLNHIFSKVNLVQAIIRFQSLQRMYLPKIAVVRTAIAFLPVG